MNETTLSLCMHGKPVTYGCFSCYEKPTNKTNEYKNGFNSCVETVLKLIDKRLHSTMYPHESIYSTLLDIKESLLKESFK